MWMLGDKFLTRSYRDYVKKDGQDMFMNQYFDTTPLCSSRFESNNTNMISRIEGLFAKGLNRMKKLPKYVIIILDDDLIQFLGYDNQGLSGILGSWIECLIKTLDDMVTERKENLPKKVLNEDYPMIYWVTCPHHKFYKNNHAHTKFNACLEVAMKLKNNMRVIKMKTWEFENNHLLYESTGAITSYGLNKYWRAVDAAFQYNAICHDLFLCKEKKIRLQKAIEAENPNIPEPNPPLLMTTCRVSSSAIVWTSFIGTGKLMEIGEDACLRLNLTDFNNFHLGITQHYLIFR